MPETIPSYCAQCRSRCGVNAIVEDGRLVRVEADPSHPSGHKICPKGRAAPDIVYAEERLKWPLKRTNPKGAADPGWQRISWDEALDTVTRAMAKAKAVNGAESVAFAITSPSASAISDGISWIERFCRTFGSPNIIYGTELCNWHKDFAPAITTGTGIGIPDFANTDCILLWGHNPLATWLAHAGEIQKGLRRGAQMIVVDPRPVGFAKQADAWLAPRPGTDEALALGLAHQLISNNRFDRAFVEHWTTGPFLVRSDTGRFLLSEDIRPGGPAGLMIAVDRDGQLRRYSPGEGRWLDDTGSIALSAERDVSIAGQAIPCKTSFGLLSQTCADFDPGHVERLTGIPQAEILRAADILAAAKSVAHYHWTGVGQHINATQTSRAITLLHALTGSYDAPGGNVQQPGPAVTDVSGLDLIGAGQKAKTLGLGERPMGPGRHGWVTGRDFYRAVVDRDPYPVTMLCSFGSNLIFSQPDPDAARQALAALEFHVHADLVMTPTAEFADIVLPVSTGWEREGLRSGFDCSVDGQFRLQLKPAVIAPFGEARSDTEIVFDLATRLGLDADFHRGDLDAALRDQIAPSGVSLEHLRERPEGIRIDGAPAYHRYREQGFNTPTRWLELYAQSLLDAGQAPIPDGATLTDPMAAGSPDFDLVLTSAKTVAFCHSQHRHIARLRNLMPEPRLEIHPDAANKRQIGDGDWVDIITGAGRFRARAKFMPGIQPDTVCGQHGWWQPCAELDLPGFDASGAGNANINSVIDSRRADPVSGSLPLRATPCAVNLAHR